LEIVRSLFERLCSVFFKAFPRIHPQENEPIWPEEAIEIFKQQVADKIVEIHFVNEEEGTDQW
jgi:hypothetical protein